MSIWILNLKKKEYIHSRQTWLLARCYIPLNNGTEKYLRSAKESVIYQVTARIKSHLIVKCLKVFLLSLASFYIVFAHAEGNEDYKNVYESIAIVRNAMDPRGSLVAGGFFITENLLVTGYDLVRGLVDPTDRSTFQKAIVEVRTLSGTVDAGIVSVVDPQSQLAIIKTLERGYQPVELGSDKSILKGERVLTVQAPSVIGSEDVKTLENTFLESFIKTQIGHELFAYQTGKGVPRGIAGLPIFSKDLKAIGMASWEILGPGSEATFFVTPINKLKLLIEKNGDFFKNEGVKMSQIRPPDPIEKNVNLATYIETPGDMFRLGLVYQYGLGGVKPNLQKALNWYEKSASQDYAKSNFHLGHMYVNGPRNLRDFKKGYEKLELAAEQKHEGAQFWLAVMNYKGWGTAQNFHKAYELFRKLADRGDIESRYNLAMMDYKGQGVSKDFQRAFREFKALAEKGHTNSELIVADMYYNGHGVEQDRQKAFEIFESLGNKGSGQARWNVAQMLYQGRGVSQDWSRAFREFKVLADAGEVKSQLQLGLMNYFGMGVAKDRRLAAYWYEKAAMQGEPYAQFQYGRMLHLGEGVPKDPEKAKYWLEKSTECRY